MSLFNYIPGVAHVKAGIHLLCNDKEGAANTMETFHTKTPIVSHLVAGIAKVAGDDKLAKKAWDGGNSSLNALPVVGHVKGIGHYVCGDIEGGNQAMKDATITTSNIADGIPVVGHVKGVVHYACGDVDGGNKAMKASTRTTAVMGAGAAGFVVGGPVGAVAGGVTAGSGWDVTTAVVTDGKKANGIAKVITNPTSVDSYFDAGLSIVGDGFAGYSGGKIAEKAMGSGNSGGTSASGTSGEQQAAAAQQLVDDLDAGKISFNEYQQKWEAMKPKDVPVKVNAEKLNFYSEKGLITERQYNQAMGEMAKTGSKQTTVVMAPSSEGLSTNNSKKQQTQQGDKDNSKDDQPPQQPTNTKRTHVDEARIFLLRRRLTELLNRIRQHREQDPMQRDQEFQIESFQEMFSIVSELISNGHTVAITSDDLSLVISSRDGSWREVLEYQLADYLDVHDQLFNQRFPLNPGSSCPTVLSAQFQGSRLVLSPQTNHNSGHAIYGIRCRLCDRRAGPCNINYVGLTKRSAHERVCGEHARAARDLINEGANGEESSRPMYEHVGEHFENGDLPEGTQARDAFRQVMDAILLSISGGPDELRSWEAFWQFFSHCRKFFWGWSQK